MTFTPLYGALYECMPSLILTYRFTESNCVANMLQISHKQTHIKGIRTKNPINAKCVQLIELHAFACCLLLFFLVALLHLLEIKRYL